MNSAKSTADQEEHWRNFYEAAWFFRLEYIRQLIASGETDPLRLIRKLEQLERKHTLAFDNQEKTYRWKRLEFPEELPSGTPLTKTSSYKGERVEIPYHVKTSYMNFVLDFLQECEPVDCIIELGCGYGRNLVELFYNGGPKIPYYGGELTESGRAIGDALASLSKEQTISFHAFDHVSPDLSWMPPCKRAFIYTVHSIEQVHKIDTAFFECIAGAAEHVIGLHLEPFGFQVDPDFGDVTKIQAEQFHAKKWNINFYETLKQAEENGTLSVDFIKTEQFFPEDPLNPTSVAIWQNKT